MWLKCPSSLPHPPPPSPLRWRGVGGGASLLLLKQALLFVQIVIGARVLARLVRTAGGERIADFNRTTTQRETVSAIVPVLNERERLAPCLDGLIAQGPELREIVVVDGGSADGTQALAASYQEADARVRLVHATPIPANWNGKAWGLEIGACHADPRAPWLLTVDADVRPKPPLTASLLAHAARTRLGVLSVATEQELADWGSGLVHPALLVTLVYRFGIPGHATRRVAAVQANGQCMLLRRDLLERVGGFAAVKASRCEDMTLARSLATMGEPVGFFETDGLVSVRMYESGWETFVNWPRSLPLRDHLAGRSWLVGLVEITLVQALPLAIVLILVAGARSPETRTRGWLLAVNLVLLAMRLGILVGTVRAYRRPPLTYWLSPLLDLPAVVQLWCSALAREHRWRGRILVRGEAT